MIFAKKIVSLEEFTLSLSGMRSSYEYRAVSNGEETTVTLGDRIRTENGRETAERKRAIVKTGDLIAIMNKCGVFRWDGFRGSHPRGVSDGTVFLFGAVVDGGRKISASGSQNFPHGFSKFREALENMMK